MQTKRMIVSGLLLATILFAALSGGAGLPAARAQVSPTEMPRTLNVTGNGKAFLTPDIVYINIGVHTENANAAKVCRYTDH